MTLGGGCIYSGLMDDPTPDDNHPVRGSIMGELADLFGKLARVFSDPEVQRTGNAFLSSINRVSDRELGSGKGPRLMTLGSSREVENDGG